MPNQAHYQQTHGSFVVGLLLHHLQQHMLTTSLVTHVICGCWWRCCCLDQVRGQLAGPAGHGVEPHRCSLCFETDTGHQPHQSVPTKINMTKSVIILFAANVASTGTLVACSLAAVNETCTSLNIRVHKHWTQDCEQGGPLDKSDGFNATMIQKPDLGSLPRSVWHVLTRSDSGSAFGFCNRTGSSKRPLGCIKVRQLQCLPHLLGCICSSCALFGVYQGLSDCIYIQHQPPWIMC